jgi:hypothetical protein
MNTDSKDYQEYRRRLATYSKCMNPVIKYTLERFMSDTHPGLNHLTNNGLVKQPPINLNFDEHCVSERHQLVEIRNQIKGTK